MEVMESGSRCTTDDELRVIHSAYPVWDRAWLVIGPYLNKGKLSPPTSPTLALPRARSKLPRPVPPQKFPH